jgi:undecaprenyl pyrophosphate synthase
LNVVGRKDMLPPAVQAAVRKAEQRTCGNSRLANFYLWQ